jgi:hypothetical protein
MLKEAWDTLKAQYRTVGNISISILNCQLTCTKVPEGSNINEHICDMTAICTQLANLSKIYTDRQFAFYLLNMLPESWSQFVSMFDHNNYVLLDILTHLCNKYRWQQGCTAHGGSTDTTLTARNTKSNNKHQNNKNKDKSDLSCYFCS